MNETTAMTERNQDIWRENRVDGIGTERLARRYGLSRQRIKQILAREDQKRSTDAGREPSEPDA